MINDFPEKPGEIEVVDNAAELAVTTAIESLARRMGLDCIQTVECLKHGNHSAWNDFFYDLSKQIAEQLGRLNEEIKAAYIDEFDIVPEDLFFGETARTTVIFLFLWVRHKENDVMNTLVEALDRALVQKFNNRIGKPQLTHLLEVRIFDDTDAKNPASYGAWLSSNHFYFTEVWRQEGVEAELYQSLRKENL